MEPFRILAKLFPLDSKSYIIQSPVLSSWWSSSEQGLPENLGLIEEDSQAEEAEVLQGSDWASWESYKGP